MAATVRGCARSIRPSWTIAHAALDLEWLRSHVAKDDVTLLYNMLRRSAVRARHCTTRPNEAARAWRELTVVHHSGACTHAVGARVVLANPSNTHQSPVHSPKIFVWGA